MGKRVVIMQNRIWWEGLIQYANVFTFFLALVIIMIYSASIVGADSSVEECGKTWETCQNNAKTNEDSRVCSKQSSFCNCKAGSKDENGRSVCDCVYNHAQYYTRSYSDLESECKKKVEAASKPPKPAAPKASVSASILSGEIVEVTGEVEVSTDGGKSFQPWKKGMILKKGDFIATGYESKATFRLAHGKIVVEPLTQLRVDESLEKGNLERSKMLMRVGAVQAIITKAANIRSDFSVATPVSIASIRGSAMKVRYDAKTGAAITAVEGTTYWRTIKGKEQALAQGSTVIVDTAGKVAMQGGKPKKEAIPTRGKPSKTGLVSSSGCSIYPAAVRGKRLPAAVSANAQSKGDSVCKANDGNEATWWIANRNPVGENNKAWIMADLGGIVPVSVVRWKGVAWDKNSYPGASPTHFKIETSSDGVSWQQSGDWGFNKAINTKDAAMIDGKIYLVKPKGGQSTARFVRLSTSQVNDGTGWALGMKEFYIEGP